METPQTATCTGMSECWTRMITVTLNVSGGQLGTGRTCPKGFTRRGQRRFHITEQVVKFDHDTVITSILCPIGDEGENTSRGVRIVSAAYGNTHLLPHRLRISANPVSTPTTRYQGDMESDEGDQITVMAINSESKASGW